MGCSTRHAKDIIQILNLANKIINLMKASIFKFSLTDVVGVAVGVVGGGGGASATAVDVATGAAVAPDDDDAVGTVVPPSSTKDEDAYVGASVAFEGACVGAFADGAGESAAASVLLPPRRPPSCCAITECALCQ